MKVKLATQVFSHSVSFYMLEIAMDDDILSDEKREELKHKGYFIALLKRISDILN